MVRHCFIVYHDTLPRRLLPAKPPSLGRPMRHSWWRTLRSHLPKRVKFVSTFSVSGQVQVSIVSKTNNASIARHWSLPYVSDARLRSAFATRTDRLLSSDEYTRSGKDPEVSGRHLSHIDDLSDDICCKGNFPAILGHEGGGIVSNHHCNITNIHIVTSNVFRSSPSARVSPACSQETMSSLFTPQVGD